MEIFADIDGLVKVYQLEKMVRSHRRCMFQGKEITPDYADIMHRICVEVTADKNMHIARRTELFVAFLVFQPIALFEKKVRYNDAVKNYAKRSMGLSDRQINHYKENLLFLYYNDKRMHACVRDALQQLKSYQTGQDTEKESIR